MSPIQVVRKTSGLRPKNVRAAPTGSVRKNPFPLGGDFPDGGQRPVNCPVRTDGRIPPLPRTWSTMTTGQRNAWLSEQGISGVYFKRRTRMFHARAWIDAAGCSVVASGTKTLAEAIRLRDALLALNP